MSQWHVAAFWATLPRQNDRLESSLTRQMAPLSNEEIFARAQQQQETPNIPPPPKLFDDNLLDDMQAALLIMEKRVQEGPLTILEVDQLSTQLDTIRMEMRANQHKKPPKPSTTTETTSVSSDAPARGAGPNVIDIDTPADEGEEYNGRGGMGQAAGTKNTYLIPGMEDMTPEEYQKALEQTVIQRQRDRRYSGEATGNRSTWDYLNSLTGETGVLKKKEST